MQYHVYFSLFLRSFIPFVCVCALPWWWAWCNAYNAPTTHVVHHKYYIFYCVSFHHPPSIHIHITQSLLPFSFSPFKKQGKHFISLYWYTIAIPILLIINMMVDGIDGREWKESLWTAIMINLQKDFKSLVYFSLLNVRHTTCQPGSGLDSANF